MLQNESNKRHNNAVLNGFPAFLLITLIVLCYFFYPSWKLLDLPLSRLVAFSFCYLLSIVLLLRVCTKLFYSDLVQIDQTSGLTGNRINSNVAMIVLLVMFGGLQLFYLDLPILSGPDEPMHVSRKLWQWELYKSVSDANMLLHFGRHLFLLAVLIFIAVPLETRQISSKWLRSFFEFLPLMSLVLLPVILWSIFRSSVEIPAEFGTDNRWPPLGTVLGIMSFSLWGANEFAARFLSLLFYCGTGFFVYKTLESDLGVEAGITGLVICLASPLFFSYGHLDFREAGGAFFLMLGISCLLLYLKTGNILPLGFVAFAVAGGFLERRPVAILFVVAVLVCLAHVLIMWMRKGRRPVCNINDMILQGLLALVVVLTVFPWIYITRDVRPYHFYWEHLFCLKYLLAYAKQLFELFPWPILLLLCSGLFAIVLKRKWSGILACISFFVLYILFTCDEAYWIPVERFAVLFVPFCSILVSQNFVFLQPGTLRRWTFVLVIVALSLNGLRGWATDNTKVGFLSKSTRTVSGYPHYPFEELLFYMKKQGIKSGNILFPAYWQSSFPVYTRMNQIWGYHEIVPPWKESKKRKTDIHTLKELCVEKNCQALIVPFVFKDDGYVKIKWIKNLTYQSVQNNQIPEFKVLNIFLGKRNGLALLALDDR